MFCKSLFVLLYFLFWSLCCLFFFDIRILITLWYLQTLLTLTVNPDKKMSPLYLFLKLVMFVYIFRQCTFIESIQIAFCNNYKI